MIQPDKGLYVLLNNGKQIAPPPQIVALSLDKLARCFPGLPEQFRLLVPDPADLGCRIGPGHFRAGRQRRNQGDAPARRMHRQMDIFDVLARHRDGYVAEQNRFRHQYPG